MEKIMEFKPVLSGNIKGAGYSDGKMQVRFKSGVVYEYEDVSQDEWDAFEKTFSDEDVSSGSHFAKHLKPVKKFKKLGDK